MAYQLIQRVHIEMRKRKKGFDSLSVVGDLTILEVKLVHEGLSIKEVIEGLISDFK